MYVLFDTNIISQKNKKQYYTAKNEYVIYSIDNTNLISHSSLPQTKLIHHINRNKKYNNEQNKNHTNVIELSKNEKIFRSIIMDKTETFVYSFSLPKSMELTEYKKTYPELSKDHFLINEIIEGTMINLWYDEKIEQWEISTKNAIGGNYYYYKEFGKKTVTFREMFMEAFCDFTTDDFKENSGFDKKYTYSFVLQHPCNQLVFNIHEPRIFLIGVFEIMKQMNVDVKTEHQVKYIFQNEFEQWDICKKYGIFVPRKFLLPEKLLYHDYNELIEYINMDSNNCGAMIINVTNGDRTKIENQKYNYVKNIRGNHPNLKYKFYELLFEDEGKCIFMNEFLHYFPKYKDIFKSFFNEFQTFIQLLHSYYLCKFVLKRTVEIPKKYWSHLYNLHNIYVSSSFKEKITHFVVFNYLVKLRPTAILYLLKPASQSKSVLTKNTNEQIEKNNDNINSKIYDEIMEFEDSDVENENEDEDNEDENSSKIDCSMVEIVGNTTYTI